MIVWIPMSILVLMIMMVYDSNNNSINDKDVIDDNGNYCIDDNDGIDDNNDIDDNYCIDDICGTDDIKGRFLGPSAIYMSRKKKKKYSYYGLI